ncbi:hypothetical protein [Sulfurospirillum sp. 1612]|uniref:hypothetical protein n=1 Tax=Sulfurospirillum sp. 1612 TaxID=3094835 RepID=UPI002F92C784
MRLLLMMAVIIGSLWAQTDENPSMMITKTQTFTATVAPDKLSTKLVFNIIEKDYTKTSQTLTSLSHILKKHEKICKNSGYMINKAMEWDSKARKNVFIGYRGVLTLECTYDQASQIETVYNEPAIKSMIARNKNVSVSNFGTQWIVSQETLKKQQDALQEQAIIFSSDFETRLSKLLKRTCMTKNISLIGVQNQPMPMMKHAVMLSRSAASDRIEAAQPSKQDLTLRYRARYVFTCVPKSVLK